MRALFYIFIEIRLLRWDLNPQPPAFKVHVVALDLPTEPQGSPAGWVESRQYKTRETSLA